ncbi:hypothetical protein J6590_051204 [Homalodisca vitripennis]|nr:hypothetical protein J6590_051204 [Homalodisca vitripennis]
MNGTNYNQLHDIEDCHSQTKTDDDRKPVARISPSLSTPQTKTDDDRKLVARISPSLSTPYTAQIYYMNGTNYNQLHDIDDCHSQTKTDDDRKPVTRVSPSLSTPYTA